MLFFFAQTAPSGLAILFAGQLEKHPFSQQPLRPQDQLDMPKTRNWTLILHLKSKRLLDTIECVLEASSHTPTPALTIVWTTFADLPDRSANVAYTGIRSGRALRGSRIASGNKTVSNTCVVCYGTVDALKPHRSNL